MGQSRIACAIGIDERDAKRIENAAMSLDGVYSRDDNRIVKNGLHNLCRYYLLGTGKFAPWLAKVQPSDRPVGIYIARAGTQRWEINDRMSIAVDTGKLPWDINDVAVVRTKDAETAFEYAKRAEEALGISFVLVHDESRARDDRQRSRQGTWRGSTSPAR